MAWNRRRNKNQQAGQKAGQWAERRPRLFDPGWRDRPFVRKPISLSTPEAKSLGNAIPYISSAACIIGFALQRYVEDIRIVSLLESVDEDIFKTLGKDLENECSRLATLISEEGIEIHTSFPHPVQAEVEITHPYGLEYAKMVENLEKLVILLCDLHNGRIINSLELTKARDKWYQLIREAGFRITKLARETLTQAKIEKAQQEQKEAEEAQEDAAAAAEAAAPESPPAETKESASPEALEMPETVPGGNGRRPRKSGKTSATDSEPEEQGKEVSPELSTLEDADKLLPPLEQAV